MGARASTDLIKDLGCSFPLTFQNPNALAILTALNCYAFVFLIYF